jgi:hypothetical protein
MDHGSQFSFHFLKGRFGISQTMLKSTISSWEGWRRIQSIDPGNLIVGGRGQGVRVTPKEYGIREWVAV